MPSIQLIASYSILLLLYGPIYLLHAFTPASIRSYHTLALPARRLQPQLRYIKYFDPPPPPKKREYSFTRDELAPLSITIPQPDKLNLSGYRQFLADIYHTMQGFEDAIKSNQKLQFMSMIHLKHWKGLILRDVLNHCTIDGQPRTAPLKAGPVAKEYREYIHSLTKQKDMLKSTCHVYNFISFLERFKPVGDAIAARSKMPLRMYEDDNIVKWYLQLLYDAIDAKSSENNIRWTPEMKQECLRESEKCGEYLNKLLSYLKDSPE